MKTIISYIFAAILIAASSLVYGSFKRHYLNKMNFKYYLFNALGMSTVVLLGRMCPPTLPNGVLVDLCAILIFLNSLFAGIPSALMIAALSLALFFLPEGIFIFQTYLIIIISTLFSIIYVKVIKKIDKISIKQFILPGIINAVIVVSVYFLFPLCERNRTNCLFSLLVLSVFYFLMISATGCLYLLELKHIKNENENILLSRENDVLIREVHHRVKNNLSIVLSLLDLQFRDIENPLVREQYEIYRNRIYSMAAAHQMLYNAELCFDLDLKDYFSSLLTNIISSEKRQIKFSFDTNNIKMDMEFLLPLGLIFNELISKSLKSRPKDGPDMEIRVTVYYTDKDEVSISIRWMTADIPLFFTSMDGIEMQIVTALSEQINGKILSEDNEGAAFTIIFPFHSNRKKYN